MRSFDPIMPGEVATLSFEFARELPAGVTIDSVGQTTVELLRGTDPAPESILVGAAALAGTDVLQRVAVDVDGASYLVTAVANLSDGQVRKLPAALPVRKII